MNYKSLSAIADTRKRKLANNTYLVIREDGGFGVRLHDTEVVIHYPDRVVLNSGGWQTVTTKARMNDYSHIRVYSKAGVWYANDSAYADGITFYDDGRVVGTGEDPKKTANLRKRVNKYAKAYADSFMSGNIQAPSGGDCWGCLMVTDSGKAPMGGADHIHSHLEDNYFVPSILNRMFDAGTLSPITKDYIARQWSGEPRESFNGCERDEIYTSVRKFCMRELGLAS